ncbi:MAG: portal protein [Desulfovibrionaceae bacterium]
MSEQRLEAIHTRLKGMETARHPWVSTWQELCDYLYPRKGSFFERRPGGAGDDLIFDSTPGHALEMLAASLHALLTNPSSAWFDIRVRQRRLRDKPKVKEFLQECRRRMIAAFNTDATGFQTNVHELYLDLPLFGTACMFVEADAASGVRFSTRPLSEVHVAESARGVVDTVYRKYTVTVRQAQQIWGGKCSPATLRKLETSPEDTVTIVHAVFPRADRDPMGMGARNMPWASVYLEYDARHPLEESGFMEMPYMCPRWAKAAGDVYGRGPGLTALSDVRVLNRMAMTALMAAEKMADTPIMVPDDGFLGAVNTGPGGISYYRAGSSDRIEPLPVHVDLRATESMMEQKRNAIRTIFLADQLQMVGAPQMTATEVLQRQEEKMRALGPVLGRLQAEFLSPLIDRVFNIMLRAGALPDVPPELDGEHWEVEFVSPVARAQRNHEAQAFTRTMELAQPLMAVNPGVMDVFDLDQVVRGAAELFAVPAEFIKDDKVVRAERGARAHAAQVEGMVAEFMQVVGLAKSLSGIPLGGGSALDMVLQSGLVETVLAGLAPALNPAMGSAMGGAAENAAESEAEHADAAPDAAARPRKEAVPPHTQGNGAPRLGASHAATGPDAAAPGGSDGPLA